MDPQHEHFSKVLDDHHQWPCPYLFKFIVPAERLQAFTALFPEHALTTRPSSKGRYVSVSFESTMCSSGDVLEIYRRAAAIPGIMPL